MGRLKNTRLAFEHRRAIEGVLRSGGSISEAARLLGRNPATIHAEVRRNGGPDAYAAALGQAATDGRLAKSRERPKLIPGTPEFDRAARHVLAGWSPEQIDLHAPDADAGRETIYRAIRDLPAGPGKDALVASLRRGKSLRRAVKPKAQRRAERVPGAVGVCERPPEADSRERFGDWASSRCPEGIRRKASEGERAERVLRAKLRIWSSGLEASPA